MKTIDPKVTNTTALAYMGDAVYEVFIRKHFLIHGPVRVDEVNRKVTTFVCANGQAKAAKGMLAQGFLTDVEERLLKRGRNHTQTSKPRGASPMTYKWATGFEALIGYLYLAEETERMEEVMAKAMAIIKGEEDRNE